jgi:RimJ/RimL family protein N-acetyltransferase
VPPQGPPAITTERLVLRDLRDDDAAAIASGAGDPRVARYLVQVPSPYPASLARRWIAHRREWWSLGRGVTYAIAARDAPAGGDDLLGTVSLRRFARDRRAELGYWIGAALWGRGLATEVCRGAIAFGFGQLELARIYAHVLAGNAASMAVLAKLGFVQEVIKRQHVRKGHHLHDLVLYGLLRDEWRNTT